MDERAGKNPNARQRKPGGVREIAGDPEPACHEQGPHQLPPGLPEIVSGNRGAFPAPALGPAGR